MGTCASIQGSSKKGGNFTSWESCVNIVHLDGSLQQLKKPLKAWHVLSQNPNCFICSSESINVGSTMKAVDPSEELQLDHIYFIVPRIRSRVPLSMQDLGQLAFKANAALAHSSSNNNNFKPCNNKVPLSRRKKPQRTHPILIT
ncbi:hypothetical protein HN51_010242 [Arachis hypogaea]|uniref:Uncharacterized protein n=2 Tax=Arachis TaxID=3817 RepID=A0A445E3Q3_ARAHY|nr:uncharacterized protein LOC107476721 [Arachis duranensis]XP_025686390.1 uncharacterized protein LOC112788924 [Arachis hypogaea]XP_057749110.1 uncharacterized protein LOC130968048 [Arachis stenosperma]RYR70074.1 hypothetical protein Ahy_A03g016590 [Arachis hypogaea]